MCVFWNAAHARTHTHFAAAALQLQLRTTDTHNAATVANRSHHPRQIKHSSRQTGVLL